MNKSFSIVYFSALSLLVHILFFFWGTWGKEKVVEVSAQKTEIKMHFSYKDKVERSQNKFDKSVKDIMKKNELSQETQEKIENDPIPQTALSNYLNQVRVLIENKKFYPASARRMKIEGEVLLKFTLDRQGNIKNVLFIQKSSFDPLNEAAMSALEQVRIFPAFPKEIIEDTLTIQQKISFKIQ